MGIGATLFEDIVPPPSFRLRGSSGIVFVGAFKLNAPTRSGIATEATIMIPKQPS